MCGGPEGRLEKRRPASAPPRQHYPRVGVTRGTSPAPSLDLWPACQKDRALSESTVQTARAGHQWSTPAPPPPPRSQATVVTKRHHLTQSPDRPPSITTLGLFIPGTLTCSRNRERGLQPLEVLIRKLSFIYYTLMYANGISECSFQNGTKYKITRT